MLTSRFQPPLSLPCAPGEVEDDEEEEEEGKEDGGGGGEVQAQVQSEAEKLPKPPQPGNEKGMCTNRPAD